VDPARYISEIECDTLNLLAGNRQSGDSSYQENTSTNQPTPPPAKTGEDDLPF
jgi:hypothetical protein